MNRVAIIVLNWNGVEDTIKCLSSLYQQTYQNFRIIVIDNGSTDDSKEKLNDYKKNSDIDIIFEKNNLGFAGGVNVGIKKAIKDKYDFVALFNNDAIADKNWLSNLVLAMDDDNVGIATGLLLRRDGKTIDSTGDWYSIWGLPFPRNRNDLTNKAPKESQNIFGATGGASLYRVEMLKEIGLFDEDFFAYYEDVDISFRAQLYGWKVKYVPKAIAYHEQGTSSNKISGFAVYQTFKNLPLLYHKNVPQKLKSKIRMKFFMAYYLMLLNAIAKKGIAKHALKGWFRGKKLSKKAKIERIVIQNGKKVSDEYIFNLIYKNIPPGQTGLIKFFKFFGVRQ